MRKTRRDRKNYNEGRADGWAEGYKQGLHDGNPFNRVIEALSDMVKTISANPELMAEAMKAKIEPKDTETWKEDMSDNNLFQSPSEDNKRIGEGFDKNFRKGLKDGDETWKEDMQRDADAYYESQEDEE